MSCMLPWLLSPASSAMLPWCERKPDPNTLNTKSREVEEEEEERVRPGCLGGGHLPGLTGGDLLDVEREGGTVEPPQGSGYHQAPGLQQRHR